MTKIVVFGNSGAGKSTFAKNLVKTKLLAHFDLDTIAWLPGIPPIRRPVEQSNNAINEFITNNTSWVIEGCYCDLIELVLPKASEIIFLNLSVDDCIQNARRRPWEPHKYKTKQQQDANLDMLIEWISQYENRTDNLSKHAHQRLYDNFEGKKTIYTSNIEWLQTK